MEDILRGDAGAYELIGEVGAGGMGIVHKGFRLEDGEPVAVKTLQSKFCHDESVCAKFMRGAEVHAELSENENIVSVLDRFSVGSRPYMVMEFIEGPSVEDMIVTHGLLPHARAVPIAVQVLNAVEFAHAESIIHRDIKPSNILIAPPGKAKMSDFDIGKRMGGIALTSYGQRLGTRPYMSPEQTVSSADLDSRSDIYSLGATLYEMCTNRLPFDAEDPIVLYNLIQHERPDPPTRIYEFLPVELERIILQALEKHPSDRFQTAEEFRTALEAFQRASSDHRETVADELELEERPAESVYGYLIPEGADYGLSYSITRKGIRLGRGSHNAISIPEEDRNVSRSHAWVVPLEREDEQVVVLDMSTNGTYVNGYRIGRGYRWQLRDGDVLDLGNHGRWRFVFREP